MSDILNAEKARRAALIAQGKRFPPLPEAKASLDSVLQSLRLHRIAIEELISALSDGTVASSSDYSLAIGTVTTAAPGDPAAATITGTAPTQTLNLTIPEGQPGADGADGIVPDGDAGDIVVSGGGTTLTIDTGAVTTGKIAASAVTTAKIAANAVTTAEVADNAVTLAKLADIDTARFLGRSTAGTGDPEVLTAAQATALLNAYSGTLKGLVPAGTLTTRFLREDGSWADVSSVTVGDTFPGSPSANALHWRSDLARPFIFYDSFWTEFVPPTTDTAVPIYITRCVKSADQAIANNAWALLTWDTEDIDDLDAHSNSTNNSRITVPAGVTRARINAYISWANNLTNAGLIQIERNGSGVQSDARAVAVGNPVNQTRHWLVSSGWLPVTPGDHFEVFVFQTSGGSINVLGPTGQRGGRSYFTAEFIAGPTIPPPSGGIVRLNRSADLSVPNNTWTVIPWDTEPFDDPNAHSTSSNTSRIVVPVGVTRGCFTLFTAWASNNTLNRGSSIQRNSAGTFTGANVVAGSNVTANSDQASACITTGWMPVTPGDHFEAFAYQNTGGALNLMGSTVANYGRSFFTAEFA